MMIPANTEEDPNDHEPVNEKISKWNIPLISFRAQVSGEVTKNYL